MTSKYHEHHEQEGQVAFLTLVSGGLGLILIVVGAGMLPRHDGWLALLGGSTLCGLAIGLWYAQEWARILVGILSLGALAWVVVGHGWERLLTAWELKSAVCSYGTYLLIPSTRGAFARARAARRREREAIRETGRGRTPPRRAVRPPEPPDPRA